MNLETLANLGEFFGGIGVIFSLVYVAIQVRGNTKSQQADITARVLDRMSAMQHRFAHDAEASAFFNKAVSDSTQLSIEERTRFSWLMSEFMGAMEFLLQQHRAGNVDDDSWNRWSATFDWWLTFPGFRVAWNGRSIPYTELFTDYMEERIANGGAHFNKERWNAFLITGDPDSKL
jgi:hypothetical protein